MQTVCEQSKLTQSIGSCSDQQHRRFENMTAAPRVDPRLKYLERRLCEAFDELWHELRRSGRGGLRQRRDGVEPARRRPARRRARPRIPFADEQQLAQIRDQCRGLAVSNEFAINGHENRISYIVGSGHAYRAATKQGPGRRAAGPRGAGGPRRVRPPEPLAPAAAGDRPPQGPRRRMFFAIVRGVGRNHAGAVRRAGPGGRAQRPADRPVGPLRRSDRSGRRGDRVGLLDRRPAGRCGRDSAPQGERRREREARAAAVLPGAQKSPPRGEAAAQHERRGGNSVGHRRDPQTHGRHGRRAGAVRRRRRPT